MRNPDRLNNFYDDFRRIHKKYFPDWRFGQLISNFFGWLYNEKKIDCWFPEEPAMIDYLREYAESMTGGETDGNN